MRNALIMDNLQQTLAVFSIFERKGKAMSFGKNELNKVRDYHACDLITYLMYVMRLNIYKFVWN
jgi:hypothetical protein